MSNIHQLDRRLGTAFLAAAATFAGWSDLLSVPGLDPQSAHAASPLVPQDGPAKGAQKKEVPFSKALSDALSDLHTETRSSVFSKTLLGGSITLDQWKSHMMQRALVLRAIETALDKHKEDKVVSTLYGSNERELLKLLENDLKTLGIGELQAPLPATQKLLDYITSNTAEDTETPWKVLGIFYVINGGTQQGGRMIVEPAAAGYLKLDRRSEHYQKSTGLTEFRKQLNAISSAEGRAQMITGARDGYRFLIDLNNDNSYKPSK